MAMAKIPNTADVKRGEDVEQQELSFTASAVQNGTAPLEDSLAVSYKTNHIFTMSSSVHTPSYLSKGIENMSTQKLSHKCLQ